MAPDHKCCRYLIYSVYLYAVEVGNVLEFAYLNCLRYKGFVLKQIVIGVNLSFDCNC